MLKDIVTFGKTDLDAYPPWYNNSFCKQIMTNDRLYFPCDMKSLESIDSISVSLKVKDFKVIPTILGDKLIVEILICTKITYTADNCIQSVHTAKFEDAFCDFILLNDCNDNNDCCSSFKSVENIFVGLEDIIPIYYDETYLELSLLLIIYPKIRDSHCNTCPPSNNSHPNNNCAPSRKNKIYIDYSK